MTVLKKIKKLYLTKIKKPYYYVPECPNCHSSRTGRFLQGNTASNTADWILNESLKNGELVTFIPGKLDTNCYCADCGCMFNADVKMIMLSLYDINQQKRLRKTNELLIKKRIEDREKLENMNILSKTLTKTIGKL